MVSPGCPRNVAILVEAADPDEVTVGPKSDRAKMVMIGGAAVNHVREVIEAAEVTGKIARASITRKRRREVARKAKNEALSEDTKSPAASRSEGSVELKLKKNVCQSF